MYFTDTPISVPQAPRRAEIPGELGNRVRVPRDLGLTIFVLDVDEWGMSLKLQLAPTLMLTFVEG